MSLTLPDKASLDQLRKQAKEMRKSGEHPTLAAAQFALAKSFGLASWPKLTFAVLQQALQAAIRHGDGPAVAALLLQNAALCKTAYVDGTTPLHQAAEANDPAIVEMLVKAGASFRPKYSRSSHTALSWAVTCWSTEAALKLVELGDQPDLFSAAGLGLLDQVKAFWTGGRLKAGASRTGSSRFSESGDLLLSPPTDPKDVVSDALYLACRNGRLEVSEWLLDHGADPNWRGFCGATCLAWAEFSGNRELCDLLRRHGAIDELRDSQFGALPNEFAAMALADWGFTGWLRKRLTDDPNLIHVTTARGTPLHAAARKGHTESARILLEAGADRKALDAKGRTPSDVAEAAGHSGLAALLSGETP